MQTQAPQIRDTDNIQGIPAVSPASLVVNAFSWLFNSFVNISKEFDQIEEFFGQIAIRLKGLEVISKHLGNKELCTLRECVVQMFICCLRICRIGSEDAKHRISMHLTFIFPCF